MITRILVALLALYIVAGSPKPGDMQAVALQNVLPAAAGEQGLARQALEFCTANREACAKLAAGLLETAPAPRETGSVNGGAARAELASPPPVPAPHLPLPPRRRAAGLHGA